MATRLGAHGVSAGYWARPRAPYGRSVTADAKCAVGKVYAFDMLAATVSGCY
jgi:hypothetical protein